MADPSVGVVMSELQETASLWLCVWGDYMEDGVYHHIGPVVMQAFVDANGGWTVGLHSAVDPNRCSSCSGDDAADMQRIRAHALALVGVAGD